MSEIISLLHRGVGLYERLIGVSRDDQTGQVTTGQYEARRTLEDLDESLALDPSGVTSVLLLRYYTESTVAGRSFNWLDLLRKPELAQQLDLPRAILTVIESPLISDAEDEFRDQLTRALGHYDALDRPEVQDLLSNGSELAFLRRDALRSIQNLRVDQFLDGDSESPEVKPGYAKFVHQWWNVNSLLDQMTRLPSGVSLNMIRQPDEYQSFFAFAIRNGARLFVLSDIEREAHPLQHSMSRRPERTLERRMARNWFPYELLNVAFDEENERIYIEQSSQVRALAVRQTETMPLQPIAEMEARSLVWTVMMFELILEKFWRQSFKAAELSYTGEMIRHEASLLTAATAAGLPAIAHQPLGLTPLTVATVKDSTNETLTAALGDMPDHPNTWMMERYGDQASEASLNLLGSTQQHHLLGNDGAITTKTELELKAMGHFERQDLLNSQASLKQLNSTAFGTKERLDQDRIWLARYNWVTQVQQAADHEYETTKAEVLAWYQARVAKNLPALIAAVGHHKLHRQLAGGHSFGSHIKTRHTSVRHVSSKGSSRSSNWSDPDGTTLVAVMATVSVEEHKAARYGRSDVWFSGWSPAGVSGQGSPLCAVTGAKAICQVTAFSPLDAQDIAWIAGCEISDLPEVLQHFTGQSPYTGNSILNRIDPAASRLKNPWLDLNLQVRLGFSKRGLEKALSGRSDDVLRVWVPEPVVTASVPA